MRISCIVFIEADTLPFLRKMAEREGFEPSRRYQRLHDFQSCSFNHSDISPLLEPSRAAAGAPSVILPSALQLTDYLRR